MSIPDPQTGNGAIGCLIECAWETSEKCHVCIASYGYMPHSILGYQIGVTVHAGASDYVDQLGYNVYAVE